MDTTIVTSPRRKPLRLWPGVIVAALVVIIRFVMPLMASGAFVYGVIAGPLGVLLIALWWLFSSRAPWIERLGAIVVTLAAYFAIMPFLHPSIVGGFMGNMFRVYAIPPVLGPAFVAWAVLTRRRSDCVRRVTMVVTILLSCAVWLLFRTDGVMGEAGAQLAWRWTKTPEQRLLERGEDTPPAPASPARVEATKETPPKPVDTQPVPSSAAEVKKAPTTAPSEPTSKRSEAALPTAVAFKVPDWGGFRGPKRNGVVAGVQIETDWSKSPPSELWRRPIGPGWSSFAVDGEYIYTQEQRGDEEMVSCYQLSTGEPVWRHRNNVRFYESNGGAGPRATPTLHNGRVYALGATGVLNALDARDGTVIWSRNAAGDTGAPLPGWGFAGSPLVVGDVLVVATSGRLAGYDLATGNLKWMQKTGGGGYSSPHLATIDGVPQVLLLNGAGTTSVAPADGRVLWAHPWEGAAAILQPSLAVDGGLLISAGDMMGGLGIRRLGVTHTGSQWRVEERWTSRGLKPYFNDYVVHKGHAFGFDGSILSCIDLQDGARKWKGGRYGQGQMLLLPDQDVVLVLSEEGELALVRATADQFTELARFKAIEGKTWNHPVLVRDVLLVRNGEEMAAFRLTRATH